MGWYVTCDICNNTEKYGLSCDCYDKEKFEIIEKIRGFTIEDNFIVHDHQYMFLCQKLRKNNEILYLQTILKNCDGQYRINRELELITEEQYREKYRTNLIDKIDSKKIYGDLNNIHTKKYREIKYMKYEEETDEEYQSSN